MVGGWHLLWPHAYGVGNSLRVWISTRRSGPLGLGLPPLQRLNFRTRVEQLGEDHDVRYPAGFEP